MTRNFNETEDHEIRNALSSIYLGLQFLQRKKVYTELVVVMLKKIEELMIIFKL